MDLDFEKQKPCPVVEVDGVIEKGKQFDLDISLPDVHRKKYHFHFKILFINCILSIVHTLINVF